METDLEKATNRLTLAYDVPSLAQLSIEWTKTAAAAYEGNPQEWVTALAQEVAALADDHE